MQPCRWAWSRPLAALALAGPLATGCDGDAPSQTPLSVTIYGESYIEDEIPAQDVVDGWTIEMSRFLVAVRDIEVEGEPLPGSFVVDLRRDSQGLGHALGQAVITTVDHPELAYRIAPPTEATAASASDDDVRTMIDEGLSLLVEGQARRDDRTVRFSWGFGTDTTYEACQGEAELVADEPATTQITIHADHLFYDDLEAPDPFVAFDLVASADVDGDGMVTADELRAVDITGQTRYQVGSRDVRDLWAFIEAHTPTLGHVDGEGHCETAG